MATPALKRPEGVYSSVTPRLCVDCEHAREIAVLKLEKERFEAAVQGSADGIWDFIPTTGQLYLSAQVIPLLGCEPYDLPSTLAGLLERFDDKDHQRGLEAIRAHLRDGSPCDFEVHLRHGDEDRWLRIRGKAQRDVRGTPTRMAGSITDITESRRASEALQARAARIRAILNHTADGIVTIDEGIIDSFNRSAERMFGYTAAEVIGRDIWSLFDSLSPTIVADGVASSHEQDRSGGFACETVGRRKDGTTFPLELALSDVFVGDRRLVTALLRDISDRKRHDAQQRAVEEALREAKEGAERASRAKTEFLANMSHEIRTPLNAIIGVADLLSEARLEEEQRQYVDMFRRAGNNLLGIVNDILDLSKVEAHKLEIESIPFDLREIVTQSMEAVAVRAFEKGVELVGYVGPEVPRAMMGDPARVRQVLINLLGNAAKFTTTGEIVLDVRPAQGGPHGAVLFSVSDTGIGIPEDKLAGIFERFSQVDASTTRVQGGTGLGLAICRGLVSLMGGRIWAENRPSGGTIVRFTATFGEAGPAGSTARQLALIGNGRRVLVVDDHTAAREVAWEMLREVGCDVASAATAARGKAILEEARLANKPFDALLVDARLPPTGDFDLLRWIAERPAIAAITVLSMPPGARAKEIGAVRENGYAGYILKPLATGRVASALAMLRRTPPPRRDRTTERVTLDSTDSHRILLVEDNPDNQALVLAYLKATLHDVRICDNGADAVARVKAGDLDLVLMDMQMPIMDGYEATRRIRAWERENGRAPVPILALTAQAMKDESERTRAAGCTGHLTKPITKHELLHAIFEHAATSEHAPVTQRDPAPPPVVVCTDPEIADLVPGYLENRRRELPVWKSFLEARDLEHLRVAAHNLAGSGAAYGFVELTRLGRALQTACTSGDARAAADLLNTLEGYLSTVQISTD